MSEKYAAGKFMASRIMYVVRIRIPVREEAEWNKWHNEQHLPTVLAQPGFLQVRKFRSMSNSNKEAEYFVLYELQNQKAYDKYVKSAEAERLRQLYLDAYGAKTTITRWAWQETFNLIKT